MEQQPPRVTVSAAAGEPALDVLDAGPEPRRRSPLRIAVAVATVALVAVAVLDARFLRGEPEPARSSAVDLTVLPGSPVRSSVTGGVALLRLTLQVRNDGPAPVRVLRGGIGGYGLARETELAPGATTRVPLEQAVQCSPTDPPDALASDTLRLTVGTEATPRTVELPLPLLLRDAEAQRACGFLPLKDAVAARVLGAARSAQVLELRLELGNRSVRPTQLAGITPGPGLRADLRDARGEPVALPRALPVGNGASPARLEASLLLRVDDCARAGAPGDGGPREVTLQLRDERGRTFDLVVPYNSALLLPLLSDVC